jgi:predicted DsbA family dithiol-disulfide isomerase
MLVDFIADVTCPWCFIGIKRLKQSFALRPDYNIELVWRPFLLNPDLRDNAVGDVHHLEHVFGNETRIKEFQASVVTIGKTVGIDFNVEMSTMMPSSVNAHCVILLAGRHGLTVPMAEAIYEAHFVNVRDIGDPDVLVELAVKVGIMEGDVRYVLNDEDRYDFIANENAHIHRIGLNGIPSFLFAGKNIISGAQNFETLLHMIDLMATISSDHIKQSHPEP